MKKILFFTIVFVMLLASTVIASEQVSPALDVIAQESSMIKAGVVYNGEISFDAYDFDSVLGVNVQSIKICSVPESSNGRLMLGNLYVVKNQVIERDCFDELRFIPRSSKNECKFTFSPNSSTYALECVIKVIDEVNYFPVATNGHIVSTWTNEDISRFGTLDGYDPDGDEITFEIVSYPKKGLVQITNTQTGDYKYTPYMNATGSDSFSYRVRDEYGNYSATTTVSIKIEKLKTTLVFEDMGGHRALNAVCEVGGLFKIERNENGTYSFNPSKTVTKEEFLALVMDAMGAKNIPMLEKTRFADDSDISPKYKGYFESAFSLGIIEGERKEDGVYVLPKSEITTAEAAIIINKIIGSRIESSTTTFADENEIPSWASDAITALNQLGILEKENGKINPNSPLTRAQTAQILMSLLEYRGSIKH